MATPPVRNDEYYLEIQRKFINQLFEEITTDKNIGDEFDTTKVQPLQETITLISRVLNEDLTARRAYRSEHIVDTGNYWDELLYKVGQRLRKRCNEIRDFMNGRYFRPWGDERPEEPLPENLGDVGEPSQRVYKFTDVVNLCNQLIN